MSVIQAVSRCAFSNSHPTVQEGSRGSSSGQRQQDRSSSTPAAIRREDVLAGEQAIGPTSRSLASEVQLSTQPLFGLCDAFCFTALHTSHAG